MSIHSRLRGSSKSLGTNNSSVCPPSSITTAIVISFVRGGDEVRAKSIIAVMLLCSCGTHPRFAVTAPTNPHLPSGMDALTEAPNGDSSTFVIRFAPGQVELTDENRA